MFSSSGGGNGMAISMNMMQARNDRRGKRAELPDEIARKLKSCSVLNCEDWRDLTAYTTYHCFPTGDKNQDRWEIWTQLLRKAREDDLWIPFRGSLVCSHHFRMEDFINEQHSKRRKLIKNAIPSIFPSFTVDLEDPSYQLPEEEADAENSGFGVSEESFNNDPDLLVGEEDYEYEYSTDEPEVQTPFHPDGEEEEDDIHVINDFQIIKPTSKISSLSFGNRRQSTTSTSYNDVDKPIRVTSRGDVQMVSTSSVSLKHKQLPNMLPIRQQMPPNQVIHVGGTNKIKHSSTTTGWHNPLILPKTQMQPTKRVDRQKETMKALNALPFPINPNLEIEMIDPEEDLATCMSRISELEEQNRSLTTMYENAIETLKQKYEGQLRLLRKRVQEQEQLLSRHNIHSTSSIKRSRFI